MSFRRVGIIASLLIGLGGSGEAQDHLPLGDLYSPSGGYPPRHVYPPDSLVTSTDLMKALDLDSSLSARKELAKDLQYDGDTNDSAKMNIWLHKQVMKKLAENGGKVPADLRT